jgi:hypothetical protein
MDDKSKLAFKVGDTVWWFQVRNSRELFTYNRLLLPDSIELVHDEVTCIADGMLICWHGTHDPLDIWGKTRQQAWDRLKSSIEKWGDLK